MILKLRNQTRNQTGKNVDMMHNVYRWVTPSLESAPSSTCITISNYPIFGVVSNKPSHTQLSIQNRHIPNNLLHIPSSSSTCLTHASLLVLLLACCLDSIFAPVTTVSVLQSQPNHESIPIYPQEKTNPL